MTRRLGWLVSAGLAAVCLFVAPTPADAYDWGGGWGIMLSPGTVEGGNMMGAGMLATGLGQFNLMTAQGNAINAETLMNFNQYLYEAQLERNRRFYRDQVNRRRNINEAADAIQRRLREAPDERDVMMGDALNVALDDITAPRLFATSVSQAQAMIPAAMIRSIPFSKASAGVTLSLNQLVDFSRWPETIRDPRFKAEVEAVKAAALKEKTEEERDALTPETIRELEDAIEALRLKVLSVHPANTFEGRQLRPFLRGLAGLARMLEMPDVQTLLKHVDAAPERSMADLIQFMSAFQLRFGRAVTPEQRIAYTTIFPKLDAIRKSVQGRAPAPATATAPPPERFTQVMTEVLGNVPEENTRPGAPIPPVPSAKPAAPQP